MNTELIGIADLAARLGLPVSWIKSEARDGRLPHLRVGRKWLFHEATVKAALAVRAQSKGGSHE